MQALKLENLRLKNKKLKIQLAELEKKQLKKGKWIENWKKNIKNKWASLIKKLGFLTLFF